MNSGLLIKYITEGFSSIKEIHLSQNPSYFSNLLKKYAQENAIVQVKFKNLNFFPRQALEVFTVILLCLLIYYLSVSNTYDNESALFLLGVYAAAILKMIPSVNLLFVNLQNIYFSKSSLEVIKKEFTEINFNKKKVSYSFSEINDKINSIELSDLNFSYDGINEIFNETNFKFEKGKIYCLSGVSGSGKSTIINLIMGFLIPNQGVIKYNNKKNILENIKGWQKKISYLSQKVFLLNDTIKKNIAFSQEEHEIDEIKVLILWKNKFKRLCPN